MLKTLCLSTVIVGALTLQECPDVTPTPTPLPEETPTPFEADLGTRCDISFPSLPTPPAVSRSFFALPTSNGYVSATYAISLSNVPVTYADGSSGIMSPAHRLYTFTDHLMAHPTPTTNSKDLLYDSYFGIRVDGQSTWLSDVPEQTARYVSGTNIIFLEQKVGDILVSTYLFAPFQGGDQALVALAEARNTGATSHQVELFSLWNFHAGGEGDASGETVTAVSSTGVLETKGNNKLYYRALEAPSHRSGAPSGNSANPWVVVKNGQNLPDQFVSGDDVAVGLQWSAGTLAPDSSGWGGVIVGYDASSNPASALISEVDTLAGSRTSSTVLSAERSFWDSFHALENPPRGLTADELEVYRQSTAVLKMSQVRESSPRYGQILASLPPGGWNISWPRDATLAILALQRSGHVAEALAALSFIFEGDAGAFASYLDISDYLVSVCRYYGDGTEESDWTTCSNGVDAGPNIELDNWGLILGAWADYLELTGDKAAEATYSAVVEEGLASALMAQVDPTTDLINLDSSIWERHWNNCFPNGRKHFTYTTVQAAHGLEQYGHLAQREEALTTADTLHQGLLSAAGPTLRETFDGESCPVLASSPEELCPGCGPYDASVVEAINLGVIDPGSALARGTLRAIMTHLPAGLPSPGFLRSDDGTGTINPYPWYDDQEWIFVDLRLAVAMHRVGVALNDSTLKNNAAILLEWVVKNAKANAYLLPELLSDGVYQNDDEADHTNPGRDGGNEYQGAVPMVGFGAGAYILTLEALSE